MLWVGVCHDIVKTVDTHVVSIGFHFKDYDDDFEDDAGDDDKDDDDDDDDEPAQKSRPTVS